MHLVIGMNLVLVLLFVHYSHEWTFDYDELQPVLESELSDERSVDASKSTDSVVSKTSTYYQPVGIVSETETTTTDTPTVAFDRSNVDSDNKEIDDQDLPIFDSKEKVEEGRQRYELIKSEAPKYGACWTNAIQSLHVGCARLNDEVQARMGLSFANCFLEKVGSKNYPCTMDHDIKSCVQSMDDRAFNTYTHFYTHTQSICFFLANQIWQESTSKVVHTLKDTSIKVSERLIKLQDLQEQSIDTQLELNEKMAQSKSSLDSFGQSLKEKQVIETEILKKFLEIKEFILSELSKFYSIGFYLIAIITIYLITTPIRTNSARFWVLILFAANLAVERFVVSNILNTESTINSQLTYDARGIRDVSGDIDKSTWMCRKATCLIATLIIFLFWLSYKDYGQLNHVLLSQIREHNIDLKKSASEIKSLQFLQLQRMGLSPGMNETSTGHCCVNRAQVDEESDDEPLEIPKNNLDIMSDFSDLDSGHEDGPSGSYPVTRIKALQKRIKKELTSPMKSESQRIPTITPPSPLYTTNQSNIIVYSPKTTYNLRERRVKTEEC